MKLIDGVLRPGGLEITQRLLEYCQFKSGDRVVDLGCGVGTTVEYLRNVHCLEARGIDLSKEAVEAGKNRCPDLPLIEASAEALPFVNHSLDGVLAECSLSVMQYNSRVLAEINRVLVKGGKLAVSDLYIRDEGTHSPSWLGKEINCLTGAKNYAQLEQILKNHNFKILVWEDRSECLKEFVVRCIMEYGSIEGFCPWCSKGDNDGQTSPLKKSSIGYFLLVAQKTD
ncbi:MAG: methyltransferase domain-containing protein [Clostridia bacterium]|nr:methyltransferase domain-containing protein [Clostridia bacterium]